MAGLLNFLLFLGGCGMLVVAALAAIMYRLDSRSKRTSLEKARAAADLGEVKRAAVGALDGLDGPGLLIEPRDAIAFRADLRDFEDRLELLASLHRAQGFAVRSAEAALRSVAVEFAQLLEEFEQTGSSTAASSRIANARAVLAWVTPAYRRIVLRHLAKRP